jgi:hypothetical protein
MKTICKVSTICCSILSKFNFMNKLCEKVHKCCNATLHYISHNFSAWLGTILQLFGFMTTHRNAIVLPFQEYELFYCEF